MITEIPEHRKTASELISELEETRKLVVKEYNPIAKDIPQPCLYCGTGRYILQADKNLDVRNFGFTPVGNPDWKILVCKQCGHVQVFRVDMAKRNDWWNF
jgi:hypothetical protein